MNISFDQAFSQMMLEAGTDTVIILGHMNPDGDAAGSVMGLAHYLRGAYPRYRILPYLSETLDEGVKQFVLSDPDFDPFKAPEAEDFCVISCDTATRARMIGLEYFERAKATLVVDHHTGCEAFGDIIYREPSEACAFNLFRLLNRDLFDMACSCEHPNASDYLYLGILHDTGCFDRADPEVLSAAARLLALGADHRALRNTMKTLRLKDLLSRGELLSQVKRAEDGRIAYLFFPHSEVLAKHIGYPDIHPLGDLLRDCSDVKLGFTMFEEAPGFWRCSFRSDGTSIDVNELLTPFGGGGHKGAAGLKIKTTTPGQLLKDILARASELLKASKQ